MSGTASRRAAVVIALGAFCVVIAAVKWSRAARGDFRIDEAHKISETPFVELWIRGEWRDPAWFDNLIDRSNPPVGKYLFGASIAASGRKLPPLPTLAAHAVNYYMPPTHPPELAERYREYLPAARRVSTIATALIAAVLAFCSARTSSVLASCFATALLLTQYLVNLFWATAVFDPLLTLWVTLLLACVVVATSGRAIAAAVLAGAVGALAFQTRLNGALFFALTLAIIAVYTSGRHGKRAATIGTIVSVASFVALTLALNPYYTTTPAPGAGTLAPYVANGGSVVTPLARFRMQADDLHLLLNTPAVRSAALPSLGQRIAFANEILFGDVAGLLLLFGALGGVAELVLRWRLHSDAHRLAAIWSMCAVAAFVVWLPLAWPRYLLAIVPPLAYLSGNGYAAALELLRARSRKTEREHA